MFLRRRKTTIENQHFQNATFVHFHAAANNLEWWARRYREEYDRLISLKVSNTTA
jgi:hypothetical protein